MCDPYSTIQSTLARVCVFVLFSQDGDLCSFNSICKQLFLFVATNTAAAAVAIAVVYIHFNATKIY
jgi:hypothetical protein